MNPFWRHPDDEQAAVRFRAEHGITGSLAGDGFVINAGNAELLPPWPPIIRLPNLLSIPMSAEMPLDHGVCARCGTAIAKREGEWRHQVGFRERGGCMVAEPS